MSRTKCATIIVLLHNRIFFFYFPFNACVIHGRKKKKRKIKLIWNLQLSVLVSGFQTRITSHMMICSIGEKNT